MLARRAMRYYRLWIYSCNVALLVGVSLFMAVAIHALVDYRTGLLPAIRLRDPSLLGACFALVLQGGLIQALGCWAALRMSERLLHAYWTLLLILLAGDVVLGAVWLARFHGMSRGLRAELRARLDRDYLAPNSDFAQLWDRLQSESQCCGVMGPLDFNGTRLPFSCCLAPSPPGANASCFARGCLGVLHRWMQHRAETLAVVGFCVVAFLKVCFLAILRYEIREMVQKIQVLRDMDLKTAELILSRSQHWLPGNGNNNLDLKKASRV